MTVFFFQVDIPADVPAFGGDHLPAFQCPTHDDVAVPESRQLPERYWDAFPEGQIGGVASWAQHPEHYRCACGIDLAFLAQVPQNWGFAMWPMKNKNVHGTSDDQAQFFLGNDISILACPARCHPEAAWPVPQNGPCPGPSAGSVGVTTVRMRCAG